MAYTSSNGLELGIQTLLARASKEQPDELLLACHVGILRDVSRLDPLLSVAPLKDYQITFGNSTADVVHLLHWPPPKRGRDSSPMSFDFTKLTLRVLSKLFPDLQNGQKHSLHDL